jgi:prepilin-type N-terminal cleavage/methylation domain-containing protein
MKIPKNKRPAFTLVELLVAAGIIAMLLALVAISYPSLNEREQLTRAVDKLRTGLLTARLWARRDNVVTGVRFEQDASVSPPKWGYYFTQQPLSSDLNGFKNNYNVNSRLITIEFPPTVKANKIKPNPTYPCTVPLPFLNASGNWLDTNPDFLFYKSAANFNRHDSIILESDTPHRIIRSQQNNSVAPIVSGNTVWDLYLESAPQINLQYKHLCRIIRNIEDIPLQEFNDFDSSIENFGITDAEGNTISSRQICFLPNGQVLNSPASQLILKLTQKQLTPPPNDTVEAEVKLDCVSGTTRYTNP